MKKEKQNQVTFSYRGAAVCIRYSKVKYTGNKLAGGVETRAC